MHVDLSTAAEAGTGTLPPLPKPRTADMRSEATCGCTYVLFTIAVCLAIIFYSISEWSVPAWRIAASIALVETAVALGMLAGLMFGDPGVVPRTAQNVSPMPPSVVAALAAIDAGDTEALAKLDNIIDAERTYCVRCFLWRDRDASLDTCARAAQRLPSDWKTPCGPLPRVYEGPAGELLHATETHHCSICQRCVRHFDHHCGVFGRCIAGRGMQGNLKYFIGIISMAGIGVFTAMVIAVAAVFHGARAARGEP